MPPSVQTPFTDIPDPVRQLLATGFSHLATLPTASLDTLAGQVSRWLDPQYPQPAPIELDPPLDTDALYAVVAAVTFQATALFSPLHRIPLEAFAKEAISAGILQNGQAAAVRAFAEDRLDAYRAAIEDGLVRAQLSTHVVPSFQNLEATVDLRVVRADDGSRAVLMPVAMVVLHTDMEDRQLVFQMTPRDVYALQRTLDSVAKRLTVPDDMIIKGMALYPKENK